MKLKLVGFYQDLPYGLESEPKLSASTSDQPLDNEKEVIRYLRDGALLIASTGVSTDMLTQSPIVIGSPDILTDGNWAWPADLPYYVEKYHVKLPAEFISHILHKLAGTS